MIKNFLLTYNVGEPYWDNFEVNDEMGGGTVRLFYGICLDTKYIILNRVSFL
jgi:hypothetical protein